MLSKEPYHDGTCPYSRYEDDPPEPEPEPAIDTQRVGVGWTHWVESHREVWKLGAVEVSKLDADHWCVRQRGALVSYASTAWLALSVVRGALGREVEPFCEECIATEGHGV